MKALRNDNMVSEDASVDKIDGFEIILRSTEDAKKPATATKSTDLVSALTWHSTARAATVSTTSLGVLSIARTKATKKKGKGAKPSQVSQTSIVRKSRGSTFSDNTLDPYTGSLCCRLDSRLRHFLVWNPKVHAHSIASLDE